LRYQKEVADSVKSVKDAGGSARESKKLLDRVTRLVDEFRIRTDKLKIAADHQDADAGKHAKHMRDAVVPAMNNLREVGDQLELVMPHEMWPLPTYREMLFIK
jgi:glutamine synthetase